MINEIPIGFVTWWDIDKAFPYYLSWQTFHSQSRIQGDYCCLCNALWETAYLLLAHPQDWHECSIAKHAQDTTWCWFWFSQKSCKRSVLEQAQHALVNLITNVAELSIWLYVVTQLCQSVVANSDPLCYYSCECVNCPTYVKPTFFCLHRCISKTIWCTDT